MRERRVLVTFDKDFGELAWKAGLPAECGIVLFRMPLRPDSCVRLGDLLSSRDNWTGHFSVIEPGRIRMRRLFSAS